MYIYIYVAAYLPNPGLKGLKLEGSGFVAFESRVLRARASSAFVCVGISDIS